MSTTEEAYFIEDHLDWWLERYLLEDDLLSQVPIIESDVEELWLISD